jgi:tRNA 2-thiouridine synthesizing protein A
MSDENLTIKHSIDVRREVCPMTFVRVRLMLDRLDGGELLEVLFHGPEPARNLPQSAVAQGHTVLSQTEDRLILRKGPIAR